MTRSPELQTFLDATLPAMLARGQEGNSPASLARIAAAARSPAAVGAAPRRLPVCDWLAPALSLPVSEPDLATVQTAIRALAPQLCWRTRSTGPQAGPGFADAHANAMILGPAGIEERRDLWLGLSLIAPDMRYPDHDHGPEETYLVLSPGSFWTEGRDWFRPGPGGSFYVPPAAPHAMRSDADAPLLAIWALWDDRNR